MLPQQDQTPSIRIVPHIDGPRSLQFDTIERTLPEGTTIKIGRFTDKANVPSRVTFKSKVVSRGHAEIWCENGKFYIRDTKSSSGTFLNHVRLSPPSHESKPHLLKDGDVVQLGVDYQGGTEEIYRCVKMRIELNRSWQRTINNFTLNALKQIRQLTGPQAFKHQTTDCCICLCGIGPCQALFLAPCSHAFHYKCIRPMLLNHPGFLCPLCRSYANLEDNVDSEIDWDQLLAEHEASLNKDGESTNDEKQPANSSTTSAKGNDDDDYSGPSAVLPEGQSEASSSRETPKQAEGSPMDLSPTGLKINGRSLDQLSQKEVVGLIDAIKQLRIESSEKRSSLAVPIPRSKTKPDPMEEDSSAMLLSRTLPSSPPPLQSMSYFDDHVGSGSSSIRGEPPSSPRLDEIMEEDEGAMGAVPSPSAGRRQRAAYQNFSSPPGQDLSSSSATTSDNDDDAGPNFSLITEEGLDSGYVNITSLDTASSQSSSRVKGKGVERASGIRRKDRENVM